MRYAYLCFGYTDQDICAFQGLESSLSPLKCLNRLVRLWLGLTFSEEPISLLTATVISVYTQRSMTYSSSSRVN